MTYEGLRLKILEVYRILPSKWRRKKLKHTDVTILSNNCWGGMTYESLHLEKRSPTVGLFFMADDYIKFLKRLPEYLSAELRFIRFEDSRWRTHETFLDKRSGSYPVGLLSLEDGESIEIFFLHYHTEKEAYDKWKRRCGRVNFNRLIVKFNDQNGCVEENVRDFFALPYQHKLYFCVKKPLMNNTGIIEIKQPTGSSIKASYEPFGTSRYLNIVEYINAL